jgi:hypothetical protein
MTPSETQAYWEGGGDLRQGRSHRPQATGAAPAGPTEREAMRMNDAKGTQQLYRWRQRSPANGGPPAWLRTESAKALPNATVAILSQIDIPPRQWGKVIFTKMNDGRTLMQIDPRGAGYQRQVILPDDQALHEVGKFVRDAPHPKKGGVDVESYGTDKALRAARA